MRILYVIDSLSPGGAERSLSDLASPLVAAGLDLDVGYLHNRLGVQKDLVDAGARIFSLDGPGGRNARIQRVHRLISHRRPDLVHTTLFESDIAGRQAARRARVPVVSSIVSIAYGPEQLSDPRLRRSRIQGAKLADRFTARRVERFHALTTYVAEVMGRRLRISPHRIDVIPRGRDPERLGVRTPSRRASVRDRLGIEEGTPLVVAAARHEFQKGLDVLLRAWPEVVSVVPAARLMVAGRQGNLTPELNSLAGRDPLGRGVSLLGLRDDVPDLLCAADAFVLPSRWEGLGSVLLEAMALEAPIVASDLPPIREVLGESAGRLVPPEDPAALAHAITATLKEASTRQVESARALFLREFTIERVTQGMLAFYERALDSWRGRRADSRLTAGWMG